MTAAIDLRPRGKRRGLVRLRMHSVIATELESAADQLDPAHAIVRDLAHARELDDFARVIERARAWCKADCTTK